MRAPFLPLFVFDGPKRPSVKRGITISGNSHWLTTGMKNIIEAFGFEWRTAPGEAEAELAYLNQIGVIDGILSDDVDTFLFGAIEVFRNQSNTLTGNRANPIKNSAGRDDKNHTVLYRLEDISESPNVKLTRGGMILIGIMSGGDYHQAGLPGCGPKTAHALAKCGFGDSLYEAALTRSRQELRAFLEDWREDIRRELRTNSQGHLGRKYVALAKSMPDHFPDIDVLLSYTNPITSETEGRARNQLVITWDREPDLGRLANVCELYFEWGVKSIILKRFRTVIWPSAILRILRQAVLDNDHATKDTPPSTPNKSGKGKVIGSPSKSLMNRFTTMQLNTASSSDDEGDTRLFVKIHSSRTHASTDGILEYRLEINPEPLVRICEAGIVGIRPPIKEDDWADDDDGDDDKECKSSVNPLQSLRVWMPASMVQIAEPELVVEFETAREEKAKKASRTKAKRATGKVKNPSALPDTTQTQDQPLLKKSAVKGKGKVARKKPSAHKLSITDDENLPSEVDGSPEPPSPVATNIKSFFPLSKGINTRTKAPGVKGKSKTSHRAVIVKPVPKPAPQHPKTIDLSETDDLLPTIIPEASQTLLQLSSSHEIHVPQSRASSSTTTTTHLQPVTRKSQDAALPNRSPPLEPSPRLRQSRKKSQVTSESDSYQDQLKKSPRKSVLHESPRIKRIVWSESDDEQSHSRPVSPSPLPARTRKCRESVIEISSESDDLFTALDTRPLLVVRARKAGNQLKNSVQAGPAKVMKAAFRSSSASIGDVIDLT